MPQGAGLLLHIASALLLSLIMVSFACYFFADLTGCYYDAKALSLELIILLRSSAFIMFLGIITLNRLELS